MQVLHRYAVACVLLVLTSASAAPTQADVAATIKAEIGEIVAGINAHDPERATKFDAPDLISMESMRPPSIGDKADREGLAMAFKYSPGWHLALIDETVDVSGDMAVYRSTYDENSVNSAGVAMTHRVNYVAGFKHDPDGVWRVHWSVVCAQSPSHKL